MISRVLRSPVFLLFSIIMGGLIGYFSPSISSVLKPFGDIFLNLLFTALPLLVFFSVAGAIAAIGEIQRLKIILITMLVTFLIMGVIAACLMLFGVLVYPPVSHLTVPLLSHSPHATTNLSQQLVQIATVDDFSKLLSPNHILALILFSMLVGLATVHCGQKAQAFTAVLVAGKEVMIKVISFIMLYAPIGFFAYFAVLVSTLGPKIYLAYGRAMIVYHLIAVIYFIFGYSLIILLTAGKTKLRQFWQYALSPTLTALATCSSAASIPPNLEAAKNLQITAPIYETVIPLGTILHKEGSILGGMVKVAFLFGLFHLSFFNLSAIITAILIAMLVGTVMGAIPSGGMLGEMLILTAYGFPPQALLLIATISILIDPVATILNVVGNTVACVVIDHFIKKKETVLTSA